MQLLCVLQLEMMNRQSRTDLQTTMDFTVEGRIICLLLLRRVMNQDPQDQGVTSAYCLPEYFLKSP